MATGDNDSFADALRNIFGDSFNPALATVREIQRLFSTLSMAIQMFGRERVFSQTSFNIVEAPRDGRQLLAQFRLIFPGVPLFDDTVCTDLLEEYLEVCHYLFRRFVRAKYFSTEYQLRFLSIAIVFGFDRALVSLKDVDELFTSFKFTKEDFKCTTLVLDSCFDSGDQEFPLDRIHGARATYYKYFREDGFDPTTAATNLNILPGSQIVEEIGTEETQPSASAHKSPYVLFPHKEQSPSVPIHFTKEDSLPPIGTPLYGKVAKAASSSSAPSPFKWVPASTINKDDDEEKEEETSLETNFMAIANLLKDLELEDSQRNLILGAALGVAQGLLTANMDPKNKEKPQEFVSVPMVEPVQDLRVDTFDYNIFGTTPAEILGKRFGSVRFPDTVAMIETQKAIFQQVLNITESSPEAKRIARMELGLVDPVQMQEKTIDKAKEKVLAEIAFNHEAGDLVPVPLLGTKSLNNNTIKTLTFTLNIEQDSNRFDINNKSSRPLRLMLPAVADIITSNQLNESSAYALLRRCLTGTSEGSLRSMMDGGMPFEQAWYHIQRTNIRSVSQEEGDAEFTKILYDKQMCLEAKLHAIVQNRTVQHEHERREEKRLQDTQKEILRDFKKLLHLQHSSQMSYILMQYCSKMQHFANLDKIPFADFILDDYYHIKKVSTFQIICCDVISGENAIFDHPFNINKEKKYYDQPRNFQNSPVSPHKKRYGHLAPMSANSEKKPSQEEKEARHCNLCNRKFHTDQYCRAYPNEKPGRRECEICKGYHTSPCQYQAALERKKQKQTERTQDYFQNRNKSDRPRSNRQEERQKSTNSNYKGRPRSQRNNQLPPGIRPEEVKEMVRKQIEDQVKAITQGISNFNHAPQHAHAAPIEAEENPPNNSC